jgi:D-alanyl-D-alanine carboxypeptidase
MPVSTPGILDPRPSRRGHRRAIATAGGVVVLTALMAGCATDPAAAPASPSASASAAAETSCVADPRAVAEAPVPATANDPLDAALADTLDAAAAESFATISSPGAVVGVQTPDGTWIAAYGDADPDAGVPMSTDVHQRIGSVTKTFTGTVVLQLAEDGLLSLDDTIDQYIANVPNGDEITLRLMLDMTSGIASYSMDEQFVTDLFTEHSRIWTPEELTEIGLLLSPKFAPGEQFDYSNTNFVMLGTVIEQVTGQPFREVVRERVIEPLGLGQTLMPAPDEVAIPVPFNRGYTLQGTADDSVTPQETTDWNPSWAFTAGQMISTAPDLLVYGRALGTGQGVLGVEAQVERLVATGTGGYGLASGCIAGWFGHTGEQPGYNTSVFYDTTSDTTVVVLVNSDIPSGDCTVSKMLPEGKTDEPCMDPATRVFAAVSVALGHPFTPNPKQ